MKKNFLYLILILIAFSMLLPFFAMFLRFLVATLHRNDKYAFFYLLTLCHDGISRSNFKNKPALSTL